ncbi:MAG TPA: helix-turn-helix transcriptional regulator [Bacilli bacterium]|nr:helix-turn-helix transcriptional regulator [Bacilli bacterium]
MNQSQFDNMISERAKLIRAEADATQDRFAEMVGISKKTLVEVEKGRKTFGFSVAVTVCVLFRHGEVVQHLFGDAALEVIDLCAMQGQVQPKFRTLGGMVFWQVVREEHGYRIQHNRVTGHYRILDPEDYLMFYSFDLQAVEHRFTELIQTQRG